MAIALISEHRLVTDPDSFAHVFYTFDVIIITPLSMGLPRWTAGSSSQGSGSAGIESTRVLHPGLNFYHLTTCLVPLTYNVTMSVYLSVSGLMSVFIFPVSLFIGGFRMILCLRSYCSLWFNELQSAPAGHKWWAHTSAQRCIQEQEDSQQNRQTNCYLCLGDERG